MAKESGKRARGRPKTAPEDFKALSIRINEDAWRQLKHLAVDKDTSGHALILEGINMVFKKNNKKPIA